jgi:hypothetical protein
MPVTTRPRRRPIGRWSRFALVPLVFVFLGVACDEDTEPGVTEATSDGIEVGAGPVDPEAVAAFRGQRNAICTEGSIKVGEVPDATSGESAADIMAGLLRLEQRVEETQASLADLDVPEELARFVREDEQRREQRLEGIAQLIDAVREGNEALALTLQRELDTLGAEAQAAEEENELEHCP